MTPSATRFRRKLSHCFSIGHRITWELITKAVQFKLQPRRKVDRVFYRMGYITKESCHLTSLANIALTVHSKKATRMIEFGVVMYRGEEIENLSVIGSCATGAIGRKHRQL